MYSSTSVSETSKKVIHSLSSLDKLRARCRLGIVRKICEMQPISYEPLFCFVKQKTQLDPQVFSRIGKTMKKLQ